MIPTTCKRLIEVDFPIAKVSEHSAKDLPAAPAGAEHADRPSDRAAQAGKSIRHEEEVER